MAFAILLIQTSTTQGENCSNIS